jgi:hypothetical protein
MPLNDKDELSTDLEDKCSKLQNPYIRPTKILTVFFNTTLEEKYHRLMIYFLVGLLTAPCLIALANAAKGSCSSPNL